MPELISLRPCSQQQRCRASLPQHFPLHSFEPRPAVERSLFEPAEHRPARRETDSESSRRLATPEFQVAQLGSPVAMTQRREARTKCCQGVEPLRVVNSPLGKSPAHPQKRQLPLAFACHEPIGRLSPGRRRARLPLPAVEGRQPPAWFAPAVAAALLSAVERLS